MKSLQETIIFEVTVFLLRREIVKRVAGNLQDLCRLSYGKLDPTIEAKYFSIRLICI